MVSINGKGNDYPTNLYFNRSLDTTKTENVKPDVPVGRTQDTQEMGRDLLDPLQPTFVDVAKIPEADRADLTEMYSMAGMTNLKMPTKVQYASIAERVGTFEKTLDGLTTTNNVTAFYNSPEFKTLEEVVQREFI